MIRIFRELVYRNPEIADEELLEEASKILANNLWSASRLQSVELMKEMVKANPALRGRAITILRAALSSEGVGNVIRAIGTADPELKAPVNERLSELFPPSDRRAARATATAPIFEELLENLRYAVSEANRKRITSMLAIRLECDNSLWPKFAEQIVDQKENTEVRWRLLSAVKDAFKEGSPEKIEVIETIAGSPKEVILVRTMAVWTLKKWGQPSSATVCQRILEELAAIEKRKPLSTVRQRLKDVAQGALNSLQPRLLREEVPKTANTSL